MVKGIDIFKKYFSDFKEQYVLIGGAACDIIFNETASDFRATKDLDLVLIIEALTPEFGLLFWTFIKDGQYQNRSRSNGALQFYRFDKPKNQEFPYMIELFSRSAFVLSDIDQTCVPVHLGDEISSLSAILLNEDYYNMLLNGKTIISDVVILSPVYLILFKAKAWLDLSERKARGQHVDERDIKKHRNDIIRLTTILTGNEMISLPDRVRSDMSNFYLTLEIDPPEPRALRIAGLTSSDIMNMLKKIYL